MGSVIKKRRKRMSKKKHRKLLRKTRHQRKSAASDVYKRQRYGRGVSLLLGSLPCSGNSKARTCDVQMRAWKSLVV